VFAQAADRFVIESQDAACIAQQAFSGQAQLYIHFGPMKQFDPETILQPFDLHTDGGLSAVQHRSRTSEGTMLGYRDKRLEKIGVEDRNAHFKS
jgi:hypothetical protein